MQNWSSALSIYLSIYLVQNRPRRCSKNTVCAVCKKITPSFFVNFVIGHSWITIACSNINGLLVKSNLSLFVDCWRLTRLVGLALGASAVGIGKPVFFALGVGGEDAVSYMLHLLQTELESAMAICGIERIADIKPAHVTRHPSHSVSFREPAISPLVRSSL